MIFKNSINIWHNVLAIIWRTWRCHATAHDVISDYLAETSNASIGMLGICGLDLDSRGDVGNQQSKYSMDFQMLPPMQREELVGTEIRRNQHCLRLDGPLLDGLSWCTLAGVFHYLKRNIKSYCLKNDWTSWILDCVLFSWNFRLQTHDESHPKHGRIILAIIVYQ